MEQTETIRTSRVPTWLLGVLPFAALLALIAVFALANPLAFFSGAFPPLEELTIQRVLFPEPGQIEMSVINGGPDPVTIAQTLVDDAYWQFDIEPGHTLDRLEQATIRLSYPWVDGEPLPITLITSTGVTFGAEVDVAVQGLISLLEPITVTCPSAGSML